MKYNIKAKSKDGHKFECSLECDLEEITEKFKELICNHNYEHHQYEIYEINGELSKFIIK